MSDQSSIEWTDATWNPVTGCTRVSPGCANCYIERTPPFRMAGRRFARVRSSDPAAGPPDEGQLGGLDPSSPPVGRAPLDLTGIDWVIIGGESGPGARPFRLEHAREIIAAARLARQEAHVGAPVIFVKQLGAKPIDFDECPEDGSRVLSVVEQPLRLRDRKGGDVGEWPADLRVREFPVSRAVAPGAVSPPSRAEV